MDELSIVPSTPGEGREGMRGEEGYGGAEGNTQMYHSPTRFVQK